MNDKKQIFGWAMYDWANSAYITTVAAVIFPLFFNEVIVPENGFQIGGKLFSSFSLFSFTSSIASFIIFLCAPFLGAISDVSASKKKFLMVFCYGGSLFSILLYFCGTGDVWLAMIFFALSQIGFVGGNIFYDAFLPQIASEDKLDWVSGKGFAYGYLGGGLQFALSIGLISGHSFFGLEEGLAVKLAMVMASLWWAGFSIVTFIYLKETGTPEQISGEFRNMSKLSAYSRIGFGRMIATAKKVARFKQLMLFLIAFMIYNDAIQTVIKMASLYGAKLNISTPVIMITFLIVQLVAFFGALLFGSIAGKISAKKALMITLVMWLFVVIYGYRMKSAGEFLFLGAIIGIVLGGSQSLSRSLYGAMIPPQASAEFYGFYSIFSKFSAIIGPAVFGIIEFLTGSARYSILSLVAFFVVGLILLSLVNVEKAKEAKSLELF
ncbi:MFS transporter [Candidatus Latescibacterota bacterium]